MKKVCLAYLAANCDIDLMLKNIDFKKLSHIAVAFLKLKKCADKWELFLMPAIRNNIDKIKNEIMQQNANTKIILSVGGAGADGFCQISHSAESRKQFAKDLAQLIDELGIDGVDVDWEFPGESSLGIAACKNCKQDFILLLKELRNVLAYKLLTIAVGSNRYFGLDVKQINAIVDYVFVMTYDLGIMHSNLYLSKFFVTMWNILGISKNKLCIGVPVYGRNVKNLEEDAEFFALNKGIISYAAGQSFSKLNGKKWCFDTEDDVKKKARWAKKSNLGGIFCWEISRDDHNKILQAMNEIF